MTCTVLSSILFGKQYHGSATLVSQFSKYMSGNTQQLRLQSLFIKCEIKLINEMTAPLIREMNKKKVSYKQYKSENKIYQEKKITKY